MTALTDDRKESVIQVSIHAITGTDTVFCSLTYWKQTKRTAMNGWLIALLVYVILLVPFFRWCIQDAEWDEEEPPANAG